MRRLMITLLLITLVLLGQIVPAAAQDDAHATHVVQPEDTLFSIALRYNVSVDVLASANGLTGSSTLVVGQRLIIPATLSATGSATAPTDLGLIGVAAMSASNTSPKPVPGAETGFTQPDLGLIGVEMPLSPPPSASDDAPSASDAATTTEPDTAPVSVPDAASAPDSAVANTGGASATDDTSAAPQESAEDTPAIVLDLGILPVEPGNPAGGAAGTSSPLDSPDLGILAPETAWLTQDNIFTLSDSDLRAIYIRGLTLGNNPHAFSKIGDCNSEPPFFLAKFDRGDYNLGPYADLQPVIDHFAGSFERQSITAWSGNHVWAVLDPTWANPAYCLAGETPLECEFRIQKPSIALIRLGTNEAFHPQLFEDNLRQVINFALEHGTIPVLGTKADRREGSDVINTVIRTLAEEYQVPLWDFDAAAAHIPARGVQPDNVHLTYFPLNYTDPLALQSGHGLQNLTALMVLDAIWQAAMY